MAPFGSRPVGYSFLGAVIAYWTAALDGIVAIAGVVPPRVRIREVTGTTPACTISVVHGFYDEPVIPRAPCGFLVVLAEIACRDCAVFRYFVCQVREVPMVV
jgi:hypothetical protein